LSFLLLATSNATTRFRIQRTFKNGKISLCPLLENSIKRKDRYPLPTCGYDGEGRFLAGMRRKRRWKNVGMTRKVEPAKSPLIPLC
jgi:hypothetical protein